MKLPNLKVYIVAPIILVLLICEIQLSISLKCEDGDDKICLDAYGEYGVCNNKICGCTDFFGFDQGTGSCVKGIPFGSKCTPITSDIQCQIILGQQSKCNETTSVCDCYSITGEELKHLNGKCFKVKGLGDSCTEDSECILGINDFGRCTNGTCGCYANDLFHFMPTADGTNCEPMSNSNGEICGNGVDISTLAVTLSISVGIFVIIVLIFRLTKPSHFKRLKTTSGNEPPPVSMPNHNHVHKNSEFSNSNETLPI